MSGWIEAAAEGEDEAAEAAEHAADDQALHLVRVDVLAEAADRVLVLADRLEHPAPRAAHQQEDDQAGEATRIQPTVSTHSSRSLKPNDPML